VTLDLDGDGLPNAWDPDNDNDGVVDYLDFSPFAETNLGSSFQVDISTSGNPTYISFQLRTKSPTTMRLIQQSWDWPSDSQGSVKDLDGSVNDLVITPCPQDRLRKPALPGRGCRLRDLSIDGSSAYIPLFPVWGLREHGRSQGQDVLAGDFLALRSSFDVSLVWKGQRRH